MRAERTETILTERLDDIPILLACIRRMRLSQLLDKYFQPGHHWVGDLTLGEVVSVWLAFLISQGDHRLYLLQPWVTQRRFCLASSLGKTIRPLDFHDDRLARILDHFSQLDVWKDFESELNQQIVRIYRLPTSLLRIDTTTASSYVGILNELGLIQFGHSKDDDSLPHIKIAVAALDPLGMPIATLVTPGNSADDPLYIPAIRRVQAALGLGGKTFVGDCKMGSLATRAYLASKGEYYLCPLAEKQVPKRTLLELLQPVWKGIQPLQQIYRPKVGGGKSTHAPHGVKKTTLAGEEEELVAEGFAIDQPLEAEVAGELQRWIERRWVVHSEAFAQGQKKQLDERIPEAVQAIEEFNQRKQGKRVLNLRQLKEAVKAIIAKYRVEGLLSWQVHTRVIQQRVRGYQGRSSRVVRKRVHRVEVFLNQEVVAERVREMGWRVYASNHLELGLVGVVWGYRGQYRIEVDWSRLKGKPLSLTPMYVRTDERIAGLVLLLSIALRILTLLEWQARKRLQEEREPLRGVYPGQPGRRTINPSIETLLATFTGINFTMIRRARGYIRYVSPLNSVQKRLLRLWNLPLNLYARLASPI